MLTRRATLGLLVSVAVISKAVAAPAAKKQQHRNAHNLVKDKLKQNGRHQIDKAGQATVSADVNNGKITAMSASHPQKGNLPTRKVKSRKKMAEIDLPRLRLAANGEAIQFAQMAVYYYAWVFDDGIDEYYYWYPAEVVIVDASWVEISF
jgi:Ni/Co efflux regulator RcnB